VEAAVKVKQIAGMRRALTAWLDGSIWLAIVLSLIGAIFGYIFVWVGKGVQ
jgi:hypothetical protein